MNYIGKCCYHSTVDKLLALGETEWERKMTSRFKRVSPFPLKPEQSRAWWNCYAALVSAFRDLPAAYGKLQIVFEYVLPQRRPDDTEPRVDDTGVRADVVLLSKDTVLVLEFKDRDALYPGCERQARKYARRLRRWHTGSAGMRRKTAIVLTQSPPLREKRYRLTACSPGELSGVIGEAFPLPLKRMPAAGVRNWMAAPWAVAAKYKRPPSDDLVTQKE